MQAPRKMGFQDIQQEVIHRIQTRIWPQGSLLPTETELAEEFGCARATVNRALRELAEQGLIDRKRKSGTRVAEAPVKQARLEISVVRQSIEEMGAAYRYALVHRKVSAAPAWLVSRMALPADARVLHLKCMHFADNRPFQFEERWINIATVPSVEGADFTTTGPNEWLLAEVPFSNAEIAFTAVAADEDLAQFLNVSQGAPLFRLERSTWFQSKPVTFVRMTYHAGYQLFSRY